MLGIYFILAVCLGFGVFFIRNRTISTIGVILFLALQVTLNVYAVMHVDTNYLEYFKYDKLGIIFLTILTIISIPTAYHSYVYLSKDHIIKVCRYYSAFIALVAALSVAYLSSSLTVTWIFVEATTLATALLIYHERTAHALEATWKYVFICSVGIALAYMGILFLSSTVDATGKDLLSLAGLVEIVQKSNPLYLKITFLFVLVGYATKMELFPMHTVGIDANSVAPSPIAAMISTTIVNVGFLAIFRVFLILANNAELLRWMSNVFLISGVLSLLVAAGYMLKAKHNKRMLAYSTLENMGVVAIALGVGGVGYYAAILHLIFHSFTKASLFFQIGQSYRVMKTLKLNQSGEYLKLFPAGGLVLLLGLVCITAIPPSGLFITEFYILQALVSSGKWIVLIPMLFLICFVVYAMATRFFHILYSKPIENPHQFDSIEVKPIETLSQYILLGMVVFFCFYQPNFLTDFVKDALGMLGK